MTSQAADARLPVVGARINGIVAAYGFTTRWFLPSIFALQSALA